MSSEVPAQQQQQQQQLEQPGVAISKQARRYSVSLSPRRDLTASGSHITQQQRAADNHRPSTSAASPQRGKSPSKAQLEKNSLSESMDDVLRLRNYGYQLDLAIDALSGGVTFQLDPSKVTDSSALRQQQRQHVRNSSHGHEGNALSTNQNIHNDQMQIAAVISPRWVSFQHQQKRNAGGGSGNSAVTKDRQSMEQLAVIAHGSRPSTQSGKSRGKSTEPMLNENLKLGHFVSDEQMASLPSVGTTQTNADEALRTSRIRVSKSRKNSAVGASRPASQKQQQRPTQASATAAVQMLLGQHISRPSTAAFVINNVEQVLSTEADAQGPQTTFEPTAAAVPATSYEHVGLFQPAQPLRSESFSGHDYRSNASSRASSASSAARKRLTGAMRDSKTVMQYLNQTGVNTLSQEEMLQQYMNRFDTDSPRRHRINPASIINPQQMTGTKGLRKWSQDSDTMQEDISKIRFMEFRTHHDSYHNNKASNNSPPRSKRRRESSVSTASTTSKKSTQSSRSQTVTTEDLLDASFSRSSQELETVEANGSPLAKRRAQLVARRRSSRLKKTETETVSQNDVEPVMDMRPMSKQLLTRRAMSAIGTKQVRIDSAIGVSLPSTPTMSRPHSMQALLQHRVKANYAGQPRPRSKALSTRSDVSHDSSSSPKKQTTVVAVSPLTGHNVLLVQRIAQPGKNETLTAQEEPEVEEPTITVSSNKLKRSNSKLSEQGSEGILVLNTKSAADRAGKRKTPLATHVNNSGFFTRYRNKKSSADEGKLPGQGKGFLIAGQPAISLRPNPAQGSPPRTFG